MAGITITGPTRQLHVQHHRDDHREHHCFPLTVSATGVNKVYDGTTAATVTLTDNRVAGDVFTDGDTGARSPTRTWGRQGGDRGRHHNHRARRRQLRAQYHRDDHREHHARR